MVGTAKNGIEAIEKILKSSNKPDVIIIDFNMPIMNGIEAIKQLLRADDSFKMILMSSNPFIRGKARSSGAKDFYFKLRGINVLLKIVKDILNHS